MIGGEKEDEAAGMISISHEHRRNLYTVNRDASLTIPVLGEVKVGELLSRLNDSPGT